MTTDEIELTYANWGDDPNVNEALAQAFMEKYPNITVFIVNMDAFTYQDDFTVMAQSGLLPDCFMVMDEIGWTLNGWLMDITELYDNDPDSEKVFDYVKSLGVYDGVRTMFASNALPNIAVLNKDYFDAYNEPLPSYDWTFEEAIDIATRLTHPEEMKYGLGKATMFNLDLLPDYADPIKSGQRGYYGYKEGEGYLFTQDWIDMVNLRNNLHVQSVFDVATGEEKEAALGDAGAWLGREGYTAINLDHFWSFDELMGSNSQMVAYPFPTSANGKVPVSSDVVGISAQTQYPREAYELAKWLTWSPEGWDTKVQAYIDNETVPDKLPNVEISQETREKFYTAYKDKDGIEAIMKSIENGFDVSTAVPGFKTFQNWLNQEGYMSQILNYSNPEVSAADIADELTAKANEIYQSEMSSLKDAVHSLVKYNIADYQ
jgi:multiple sugar transport system substrate-binding protein